MKTLKMFVAALAVVALSSCGGGSKEVVSGAGEQRITIPCSGPSFQDNDEYVRVSTFGESSIYNTAQSMALTQAQAMMAQKIEALVKRCNENYAKTYGQDDASSSVQRFEDMSMVAVKQTLRNCKTICEDTFKTPANKYKYYICLEMSLKELMDKIAAAAQEDAQLKSDFDAANYRKVLEKEVNK